MAQERSRIDQLLAEYYKLDYEDDVAGIKTRFRWAQEALSVQASIHRQAGKGPPACCSPFLLASDPVSNLTQSLSASMMAPRVVILSWTGPCAAC